MIKRISVALSICLLLGSLVSCNKDKGGDDTTGTGAATTDGNNTTDVGTEPDPELDPISLFWIQWSGSQHKRPDGSTCAWDWQAAQERHVTNLNVYYRPTDSNGTIINGLPDTENLKTLVDQMRYDIDESAKAGIAVTGYGDTVQFQEASATRMGYTLDQLCATQKNGAKMFTTTWCPEGCYIACINSPEWRDWQRQNIKIVAEGGFADYQFDFHPLAAGWLFCHCQHCKDSWAAYSKEVLGEEQSLLSGAVNCMTEKGRAFWKWRMQCLTEFKEAVEVDAKKVNPDFNIIMNNNASGYNFGFEGNNQTWDLPTSEVFGSNNGYSSTLYLYQLTEAYGYDQLRVQYTTDSDITPDFRLKTNYGESMATIGGLTCTFHDFSTQAFEYLHQKQSMYVNTESLASAAVLYSAESNFFSVPSAELSYYSYVYGFSTDRARQAASALVLSGVCYDYLAVELDNATDKMAKYDLLVLPDYTYFDEGVWKPVLEQAVKNNSKIVVVGEKGKDFVESLSLTGNIVYVDSFKPANEETEFNPGDEFKAAVADTAAAKKVVLKNNLNCTAATIRTNSKNKAYIHVVRRGGEDKAEQHYQELSYTVPEGKTVTEVKAYCAFTDGYDIDVEWSVDNGVLNVKTADFDTYAVISVVTK